MKKPEEKQLDCIIVLWFYTNAECFYTNAECFYTNAECFCTNAEWFCTNAEWFCTSAEWFCTSAEWFCTSAEWFCTSAERFFSNAEWLYTMEETFLLKVIGMNRLPLHLREFPAGADDVSTGRGLPRQTHHAVANPPCRSKPVL